MKKIFYIIIAIGLPGFNASAQKQLPPAGGIPKDFVLPAKKQTTMANGMRTTMVQYGIIPKAYASLIIKTGNVHEAANQVWLADLLARLMNEGTTSISATALAKKMATMGGQINISTGTDQVTIAGSVLSEYAPELVKVIADVVMNPALPEKEMERLKNDLKRNVSLSKTVPQSIAMDKFITSMYGSTPYGTLFPADAMLDSYTIGDVKKFYADNLGASRSVLYVAGKFDETATTKAANESFGKWKAGPPPSYPTIQHTPVTSTVIVDRKKAPQTTIMLGMPTITPNNPDYLSFYITNAILGGSFASRITSNIREQKGYTYSPFSTLSTHPHAAAWYEQADVTSEHTIDAVNEIKKEITRLQQEVPGTEELAGIQRYAAGAFVLQNSSPAGIINQLNFLDLHGLSDSYLANYVKNIYAVTPQKVTELAKKYLPVEKLVLIMVGDEASIKEQQAKSGMQ